MSATLGIQSEVKEPEPATQVEIHETEQLLAQLEGGETQNKPPEPVSSRPKKRRLIRRVILIAVALLLAVAAYVERTRLIGIFYAPQSDDSLVSRQAATTERKI